MSGGRLETDTVDYFVLFSFLRWSVATLERSFFKKMESEGGRTGRKNVARKTSSSLFFFLPLPFSFSLSFSFRLVSWSLNTEYHHLSRCSLGGGKTKKTFLSSLDFFPLPQRVFFFKTEREVPDFDCSFFLL